MLGWRTLKAGFSWHLHISLLEEFPLFLTRTPRGYENILRLSEERTKAGWHHSGRMRAKCRDMTLLFKEMQSAMLMKGALKVQTNAHDNEVEAGCWHLI